MKLFIDIETVKQLESIHHMPDGFRLCYEKKFGHELENNVPGKYDCFEDHYDNKAALYAKFGKVVGNPLPSVCYSFTKAGCGWIDGLGLICRKRLCKNCSVLRG